MLRSSVLLALAAALLAASLGLSWGSKTVTYESCALDEHAQPLCLAMVVHATYDPAALRGYIEYWEGSPGALTSVGDEPFWHPYDRGAGDDSAWWHSALLTIAKPLLLAAAGFVPVALAVAWTLRDHHHLKRAVPWVPIVAVALILTALAASLGGVLFHAATWAGSKVAPLRAMPGAWVLLLAGLLGFAGGLRLHNVLRDRLVGWSRASPLVPAERLFGFETTPAASELVDKPLHHPTLRPSWPRGGTIALFAAALLLLPLGLPLAEKEITLRTCQDVPGRGSVCHEDTLQVSYRAGSATVHTDHASGAATDRSHSYFGAFQDAHGGPGWMGLGALLVALGAMALLAWFVGEILHQPIPRLRWIAIALLALGSLGSITAVAWQAGTWLGTPAQPSRPGLGFWSAFLGLLALGRFAWQCLRDPTSSEATARATRTSD